MKQFAFLHVAILSILFISACSTLNNEVVDPLGTKYDDPPKCEDYKDKSCDELTEGRMTGGINILTEDGIRVTGGLTIHCDNTLSNNIQLNWDNNTWHIKKESLENIICTKPGDPTPPEAPLNVFSATAMGKLNGVEGSRLEFTFVDNGEPGRNDTVAFTIYDQDETEFFRVDTTRMERGGNLQAHFDQPHK